MPTFPYKRILVIGATGSGKSTLGLRLAKRLELDFVELDALHWQANWRAATPEELQGSVREALQSGRWVVAGNYHIVRDLIWSKAEAVVWLDLPFFTVFWRLLVRTLRRSILQEELWNGNREKFWWHLKFWSDESLFVWLLKTYWRRRREYPQLFAQPQYSHLQIIRLQTAKQADAWLASL